MQRGFGANYLKKHCVTGTACNLISNIEIIEEIWKKWVEVYGDTQLLIQNKISSLGRTSNLEKLTRKLPSLLPVFSLSCQTSAS